MKDTTKPTKRKIGSLITKNLIVLLVLIAVCVLFNWSWFTDVQTADANGINIQSSADGVQVSWDGVNWYNDLTALNDADVVDGVTGMAKNISGKKGVPEPLNLITGNGLKFFEPLLNRKSGEVLVNHDGSWKGEILQSRNTGKFIDIDLYFRSEFAKDVYLAGDSVVSPKDITQRYSEYGNFSKDYIAAASRIAFLNSDKSECSFIWAPNADIELEERDAVHTKYTTLDENNNYTIPNNTYCALANPDYGVAISSGQEYKKSVIFTDDEKKNILPLSITMSEQFIAEKLLDTDGGNGGSTDNPTESEINIWTGSFDTGFWSGGLNINSLNMAYSQVGDVLRVNVTNAQSDSEIQIKDTDWQSYIPGCEPKPVGNKTYVDFDITARNIEPLRNGFIAQGKNATIVSVVLIKKPESAIPRGTAVGDSARIEIENAECYEKVTINDSSELANLASGNKYYYIENNGYAYVPFYVERTGYYSLDVITASNNSTNQLRVLASTSASVYDAVLNKVVDSPATSNTEWRTVDVDDNMFLKADKQYYIGVEMGNGSSDGYISIDAFDIAYQSSESEVVLWSGLMDFHGWEYTMRFSSAEMLGVQVGDVFRIYATDLQSYSQATIQDASWSDIDGNVKDFNWNSYVDFTVTESNLERYKGGIAVKGNGGTLTKIEWLPNGEYPSEQTIISRYKFKNKKTNEYLDLTNGVVSFNETGSEFILCNKNGYEGPVLKSGNYYLAIQNGLVKAVEESDFDIQQAVTVYTGGSYLLNINAENDTQQYTYYDYDQGELVTLGESTAPKLFTSASTDPETKLIGNTRIAKLEKENDTDKYYTAHVVMRIWVEGTDREAKTPLVDGIFDTSLHFASYGKEG